MNIDQEGDVLGVEEGVGVQAGLQEEQQQGEQRQAAVAEQADRSSSQQKKPPVRKNRWVSRWRLRWTARLSVSPSSRSTRISGASNATP